MYLLIFPPISKFIPQVCDMVWQKTQEVGDHHGDQHSYHLSFGFCCPKSLTVGSFPRCFVKLHYNYRIEHGYHRQWYSVR